MSYRAGIKHSLLGIDINETSYENLDELYLQTLKDGMHGLCYSAYELGQQPGDQLSEGQIRKRMQIIAPFTKWIRTFSCIEGNELIPRIAKEFGIKTMVGAWLGDDKEKNEQEIEGLLTLAKNNCVDIAGVGNEVLYRNDLQLHELLEIISRVKNEVGSIPVGYVDAYYEFTRHPELPEICDVLLINCYPFWEGCHIDYSLIYMKQMYQQALNVSGGKKVIISETGWPSQGTSFQSSEPSRINAMKYFINAQRWSAQDDIEMFYFTSFDENWKVGDEGDVGAYWGLWDIEEKMKFV